jgi:hypothetical protein
MVEAFSALQRVVKSPAPISLKDFRQALEKLGDVLNSFDQSSMGDNTTFAVFDELIRLHSPESAARSSSMALTASPGGEERHIVFLLPKGE